MRWIIIIMALIMISIATAQTLVSKAGTVSYDTTKLTIGTATVSFTKDNLMTSPRAEE